MTTTDTNEAARAELATALAEVQGSIDSCSASTETWYARRLELLRRGQDLGMTVPEMAAAAGVKPGTFGQVLHKARRSEAP